MQIRAPLVAARTCASSSSFVMVLGRLPRYNRFFDCEGSTRICAGMHGCKGKLRKLCTSMLHLLALQQSRVMHLSWVQNKANLVARMILHLSVVQLLHGGVGDILRLVLDEAVAPIQAAAGVLQHCTRVHLQASRE